MRLAAAFILYTFGFCTSSYAQSGEEIYGLYCAGCHGAQLQGNTAAKLIKTEWIYGRGRNAIFRNIKFGIPSTEMIKWEGALNDDEIRAVADYIIARQEVPPTAERPIPKTLVTKDYRLNVEVLVATDIQTPWGIEFIDSRSALISERTGGIRWLVDNKLDPQLVEDLPQTYAQGATGGFMDIALDPDYNKNGWIYLAYSETTGDVTSKDASGMTKVIRGKIANHRWVDEQTLFEVPETLKVSGGNRWGGRLMFDKEGFLYFSIGDMARADDSQDVGKPSGKVFRIHADGSIPRDNPYVGNNSALAALFSIGNRNVQGIAQHPISGEIWATEHGPMGGDELNILKKGANYGWPVITYGIDYSGKMVSNETERSGMEQPVVLWTPSIAVCPAEFVTGGIFSKWKNNLLVGALAFEEIRRLTIEGDKVLDQEIILKGVGRVRDLKIGPDGALYVLLNNPDKILRITPESNR
jgi:glucose/arabinose dehydrogenase